MPDCNYIAYYTSSLKNDETGGFSGSNQNWPSYIQFENSTLDFENSMYYSIYTDDLELAGNSYIIVFTVTFVNENDPSNLYIDN